ncbi:replication-relaxation family protein [Streptomyces olivochromogenes]|uniref:replication-relaxation family protein n=1 Tax=Streptomyces olivochromogenes TaxID=1963 RepID=UPI0036AA8DE4
MPTKTSDVRLFELDNGTMSPARLAKEVWDYERYAGHRAWEGARYSPGFFPPREGGGAPRVEREDPEVGVVRLGSGADDAAGCA